MKAKHISVGDRVGYAAHWLRAMGCFTGDTPRRRGVVVASHPRLADMVMVRWDDETEAVMVRAANVARVGSVYFADNAAVPKVGGAS